MEKETSDKLNDTLGKMGAIDNGDKTSSDTSASQSSDMSFYVFMLAIIVAMAFYVSYDMEQRYGSDAGSIAVEPGVTPATEAAAEPVVVNVEKVVTVDVKPVAEIPATETTPEAVVVEKTKQKTVVTTVVVPLETGIIVIPKVEESKVEEAKVEAAAPVVSEKAAPVPAAMPMVDSMIQTVEVITAPVVEAVDVVTEAVQAAPENIPAAAMAPQPAPDYNPYGNPYGNPYQGYQQPQQPQYGNPYGNPYNNNPYGNPYNNPYANPYGNPYQQPAAQPAQ